MTALIRASVLCTGSVRAWRCGGYLSLAQLLSMLTYRVRGLEWAVQLNEVAPEPGSAALESLKPDHLLTVDELLSIASPNVQIIDGLIEGRNRDGRTVIRIRAVDSTWWDIEADDSSMIKELSDRFPDALPVPSLAPIPTASRYCTDRLCRRVAGCGEAAALANSPRRRNIITPSAAARRDGLRVGAVRLYQDRRRHGERQPAGFDDLSRWPGDRHDVRCHHAGQRHQQAGTASRTIPAARCWKLTRSSARIRSCKVPIHRPGSS